jgi:hypothetical protein
MKYMMTSDEYYNRKVTQDYLEEELRSQKGCRLLVICMFVIVVMAVIAYAWSH